MNSILLLWTLNFNALKWMNWFSTQIKVKNLVSVFCVKKWQNYLMNWLNWVQFGANWRNRMDQQWFSNLCFCYCICGHAIPLKCEQSKHASFDIYWNENYGQDKLPSMTSHAAHNIAIGGLQIVNNEMSIWKSKIQSKPKWSKRNTIIRSALLTCTKRLNL